MPSTSLEFTPYEPVGRLLLEIAYDGTEYGGWQIQPHCATVQGTLQATVQRLYGGIPIHLIGASRTDAGVHALGFAASYLIPARPAISPEQAHKALNRLLPPSIRIRSVRPVAMNFHTRYDAKGKTYAYILNLGPELPFTARYAVTPTYPVDPAKLEAAAQRLVGTHDFSSFVVERNKIEDAVRTIYSIRVREFGPYCAVTFTGNGFLYKMIRCLMGTLLFAAAGKLSADDVTRILELRDRDKAKDTAPAHGLYLVKTYFDQTELETGGDLEKLPFY